MWKPTEEIFNKNSYIEKRTDFQQKEIYLISTFFNVLFCEPITRRGIKWSLVSLGLISKAIKTCQHIYNIWQFTITPQQHLKEFNLFLFTISTVLLASMHVFNMYNILQYTTTLATHRGGWIYLLFHDWTELWTEQGSWYVHGQVTIIWCIHYVFPFTLIHKGPITIAIVSSHQVVISKSFIMVGNWFAISREA